MYKHLFKMSNGQKKRERKGKRKGYVSLVEPDPNHCRQ